MKYAVQIGGRSFLVEVEGEEVRIDGQTADARIESIAGTPMQVLSLNGERLPITVVSGGTPGAYTLWTDRFRLEAEALDERTRTLRELAAAKRGATGPAPLTAPMPGLIVRVQVAQGDAVEAGQALVVMEAMKMENELRASARGTVSRILVQPGQAVEKGSLLVQLAPLRSEMEEGR